MAKVVRRSRSNKSRDGSAYGYAPGQPEALLTEVGPGKPCGEFMRRYWQPVLASAHVTPRPQEIRILGEDLIAFRDRTGRPGLLYPRCMHRGTSLFWGHVEDAGIRCCYHGWLFDVEGNCLEQPCEPDKGKNRGAARQPWYPVQERYGLAWTYMGPPERSPILPRFDVLENLQPGEEYWVNDASFGSHRDTTLPVVPYSWLHMNDNIMDPFHVQVLHSTFSVHQFAREFEVMPTVDFEYIDAGMIYKAYRKLDDGREVNRVSTALLPNIMSVPSVELAEGRSTGMGFVVPVDDTHCRIVGTFRLRSGEASMLREPARFNGKRWSEMSIAERQDIPGDYEAQAGQGPVSLHGEEHLAGSDRGIIMLRKLLREQIGVVQGGGDPAGVIFDPERETVRVPSGNFFSKAEIAFSLCVLKNDTEIVFQHPARDGFASRTGRCGVPQSLARLRNGDKSAGQPICTAAGRRAAARHRDVPSEQRKPRFVADRPWSTPCGRAARDPIR